MKQRPATEALLDGETAEPPKEAELLQREATAAPPKAPERRQARSALAEAPAIILAVVIVSVAALSLWYLVRPEPLLVQGEVDATRLDIAARVDGRVADIPVVRGQNVSAGAVLVRIDNPETMAKLEQARAAKVVAQAQLANIDAGTRPEVIAARKAAQERAEADVYLRTLLIHGARSVLRHLEHRADQADSWLKRLMLRRGKNVAAVALANKNARIAWALLAHQREFDLDHVSTPPSR